MRGGWCGMGGRRLGDLSYPWGILFLSPHCLLITRGSLEELGQERAYVSETVFTFVFLSFFLWTFHPFIFKSKKIYTVLIWCRVLPFLIVCRMLCIITFYSTVLPGPNYHCREGSQRAMLPRRDNLFDVLLIIPRGVLYGCGDLIFSSHMIFSLVFV